MGWAGRYYGGCVRATGLGDGKGLAVSGRDEKELGQRELGQRPFGNELADKVTDVPELGSTEFEKARGVNRIETREGFAGVLVWGLGDRVMEGRLAVLEAVRQAGLSIDFLKFTNDGLSFLIGEPESERVRGALEKTGVSFETLPDRSILTVHAVNMRDEAGLVARVVSEVISSGAHIDHMGDMHDRLLIVMTKDDAKRATEWLLNRFTGVTA